jgi:phosphoglycolate phosphatase-like HAD superfamily hydrolase
MIRILYLISLLLISTCTAADPLPSWNEGSVKTNIIQFVNAVTSKNSPDYVTPSDRIATFDNDGTLWLEQPMYTQLMFAFARVKAMSKQHSEWKNEEPFSLVLNAQYEKLQTKDLIKILTATQTGMSVEAFQQLAQEWLATATDARFQHHYTELVYQPILEVMNYLRRNQFKIYIVSGGGQDFMRAFAEKIYGIPPENIIGSAGKTQYIYQNGYPNLIKLPELLLNDDKAGKPEDIHLFIGKKPIITFGNSTGDQQMLEWTQSNNKKHLMLLVHHDDAEREYAYGPHSKIGTFSDALMQEANKNNWQVISMKKDWKIIFPFQRIKTEVPQ